MNAIVVHYKELALKGSNRPWFVQHLIKNLRVALSGLDVLAVRSVMGRIEIELGVNAAWDDVRDRVARVFGIANFSHAGRAPHDLDALAAAILGELGDRQPASFRVSARRADKRIPLTSPQIEREVGGRVKLATGWSVNLERPELTIHVEMLPEHAFYFFGKEPGAGGLPTSTSGRVACLMSGGIDSPVAAYRMMRRGCSVLFIHFHSYPILSRASQEKVREIAALLTRSQLRSRLVLVPFGELQQQVLLAIPAPLRVVVYRRLMLRIAERIARSWRARALVTGEVVGQVASQTLENLTTIAEATNMTVLRPLIGMDKDEISAQAERIGTFPISIIPDQDCCTLFTPRHPATRATRQEIEDAERALPVDEMVKAAIDGATVEEFRFPVLECEVELEYVAKSRRSIAEDAADTENPVFSAPSAASAVNSETRSQVAGIGDWARDRSLLSENDMANIQQILGEDGAALLQHQCKTIPKDSLHLPGPDFIDRILLGSDRPPRVLGALQSLFGHGRLGGTGYVSILPVDQGIEHSAGASFAPNPAYFDSENIVKLAIEGGCNAVASTLGVLGSVSRKYAHRIPFILKVNHNEFISYPNSFDQIRFASVKQAFDLGAVGVGATIYFGSEESKRQLQEVAAMFQQAHELGMFTVLWCYLRNPAFKTKEADYHVAADLTGQANHLGVTIEADIIKQKLPETNGGFTALNFGKTNKKVYSELTTDHPIDLTRYQVANCYMGRMGLINSGGASAGESDLKEAVRTAVINKRAGGMGLISGRKAFQRPLQDGVGLLNAIQDVYLSKDVTIA